MGDPDKDSEDSELISAASRGDVRAVDSLMAHHLPGLRAFVRLRMGAQLQARESASDLVQSACREVLQHMDRYQYQGESNFRQWLFMTALRKVRNRVQYYRAQKRDVDREIDVAEKRTSDEQQALAEYYQTMSTPSGHLQAQEFVDRFEQSFGELPEDYRTIITLSRVVGLSHREIAAEMGRTEAACRSLLIRALSQLAEILDRDASRPE